MKECFRNKRFGKQGLVLLFQTQEIIEEYRVQDITMTLRQLYYQLVSRGYIENQQKEYAKLSRLVTDARYCGEIDWRAIEDRIRVPRRPSPFEDVQDLVECAKASYRLDRWIGQEYYIELFTEKDALSSVLYPIAQKWHIYFNVNRGYASATAIYDTSKRFISEGNEGKNLILLYLGDHDPSGLDMNRDISDRLSEFDVIDLDLIHIALTTKQVKEHKPPPNPAKISDPRAKDYIANYGETSWEVDALRPELLIKLVESSITEFVDEEMMDKIIAKEKKDIKKLETFAKEIK